MGLSYALRYWRGPQADRLAELKGAHAAIGGTGPGRRYRTTQLNHALIVAVAAEFQGYCRTLHTEAVSVIADQVDTPSLRDVIRAGMTDGRALDRGSARVDVIASDFERIGLDIWSAAEEAHRLTRRRRDRLKELLAWRNAIVHRDFARRRLGGRTEAHLEDARRWQRACDGLAETFDRVVGEHLRQVTGAHPWTRMGR